MQYSNALDPQRGHLVRFTTSKLSGGMEKWNPANAILEIEGVEQESEELGFEVLQVSSEEAEVEEDEDEESEAIHDF